MWVEVYVEVGAGEDMAEYLWRCEWEERVWEDEWEEAGRREEAEVNEGKEKEGRVVVDAGRWGGEVGAETWGLETVDVVVGLEERVEVETPSENGCIIFFVCSVCHNGVDIHVGVLLHIEHEYELIYVSLCVDGRGSILSPGAAFVREGGQFGSHLEMACLRPVSSPGMLGI